MQQNQQKSESIKREMYARSFDTIRVHNPTNTDFVEWYDKYGDSRQKYTVPHRAKNIGLGAGNNDLPRYLAERYAEKMIIHLINKKSHEEWEEVKKNYRVDERSGYEEKYALRTNNRELWKEYFPKLWLGVIEKYGGEELPDPQEPQKKPVGGLLAKVGQELDLVDKDYVEEIKQPKAKDEKKDSKNI